jgi:crossover junction endodeoxyribonuclease RuvC
MTIVGIDPGYGRLGWGVISQSLGKVDHLENGCLETDSEAPFEKRLELIYKFVSDLIKKYEPEVVAVEKLFFAANSKTAIDVGQARGVVLLAASQLKVPISSFTPLQVKLAITGYGKAEKNQIQLMVKSLLKLKEIPRSDDAADALAVALTSAFSYKYLRKSAL